jgi:hypothetical protein
MKNEMNRDGNDMVVVKASMTDNTLSMILPIGMQISGKLNFFGAKIDGTVKVKEGNQTYPVPLSLTKE